MRRTNMCHKINRNSDTTIDDVDTNPVFVHMVDPEFVGGQSWLQYDVGPGVDIIEINDSDNSETTSDESPKHNLNHAWCYINNTTKSPKEQQNNYKVNKKARERRRLKDDVQQSFDFNPNEYVHNSSIFFDNIDLPAHNYKSNVRLNHQINCFTIINKHFINSDTSSDNTDFDNSEINRPMGDAFMENHDRKNAEEELLTYNSDFDAEKKTIWIYSFKNKHLLSDDCIELVNIPSKDIESCTSFSFEKFEKDPENITRAASPIPPPYIPRLNLTLGQTLSTVTEITEPNKQSSSVETERSVKAPVIQKPKNSWLPDKYNDEKENMNKQEKSTNVLNWMALSPRERRRVFKERNSDSDVVYKGKLSTLQEVCPNDDKKTPNVKAKHENIETYKDVQSTTVDIDIHVAIPESTDKSKYINNDLIKITPDTNVVDVIERETISDVIVDDNIHEVNMCSRKPQIKVKQKCAINVRSITDPMEKLNSDNWIVEEEKQTAIYNYDMDRITEVLTKRESEFTATDKLWSKNALALMKPAQWSEYAPIGESHLSLHLSLTNTFEKQTWFSRLVNLFKCCK